MGQLGGNIASSIGSGGSLLGGVGQNMLNKNVIDPSQANWADLDPSEKFARVGAQGMRGALNGFSNMQQQQRPQGGGYIPQFPIPQAPPIQFPGQDFKPSVGNNGSTWPGDSQTGSRNTFYGVY